MLFLHFFVKLIHASENSRICFNSREKSRVWNSILSPKSIALLSPLVSQLSWRNVLSFHASARWYIAARGRQKMDLENVEIQPKNGATNIHFPAWKRLTSRVIAEMPCVCSSSWNAISGQAGKPSGYKIRQKSLKDQRIYSSVLKANDLPTCGKAQAVEQ